MAAPVRTPDLGQPLHTRVQSAGQRSVASDDQTKSAKSNVEEEDEEFFDDQWEDDDAVFETMDDTVCQIEPGLFISGFLAEQNKDKLQKAGITHVLQVAEGLSPSHPADFQYQHVSVLDSPTEDLATHFQEAFDFISGAAEQQGATLVHCVAGVSRSATICIAYLMWQHKISYDEAFRRVHAVRPWIMPNVGFRYQLQRFHELGCDPAAWRTWRNARQAEEAAINEVAASAAASLSLSRGGLTIPNAGAAGGAHGQTTTSPGSTFIPELGTSF